jgi:hypothetical protein
MNALTRTVMLGITLFILVGSILPMWSSERSVMVLEQHMGIIIVYGATKWHPASRAGANVDYDTSELIHVKWTPALLVIHFAFLLMTVMTVSGGTRLGKHIQWCIGASIVLGSAAVLSHLLIINDLTSAFNGGPTFVFGIWVVLVSCYIGGATVFMMLTTEQRGGAPLSPCLAGSKGGNAIKGDR